MGVYFKNMQMPRDCPMCPMAHYNKQDEFTGCDAVPGKRYAVIKDKQYAESSTRPDWCTALEINGHGRLIDADNLIEDLKYDVELDAVALDSMELVGDERRKIQDDKDFKQNCIFWIENAPTVIEAEEVYGQYTDTAGNFHWCGTHSGEHTIKA